MKCYLCKKEIEQDKPFEGIGQDKYRHKHCYPGLPKNLDGTEMKVREHFEEKPKEFQEKVKTTTLKIKRGRGRPKGSKNKEK